jgi:preprotein translocase subunit YajC
MNKWTRRRFCRTIHIGDRVLTTRGLYGTVRGIVDDLTRIQVELETDEAYINVWHSPEELTVIALE